MTPRSSFAPVLLALLAAGCEPPPPQPPEIDREAIEAEVGAWLDTFWATWSEGRAGFDRGIAMYDDHPDFALAYDGVLWRSLPSAAEAFRPVFESIVHQDVTRPETAVSVLGQDLAHVAQSVTTVQTLADGTTVGPLNGSVTMVLVRAGGVWRIRYYHESTVPAGATP